MASTTEQSTMVAKVFHPNPICESWYMMKDALMDSNGGVHNPACKCDSMSCSAEMSSDVSDLCAWHRIRMARHVRLSCGCGSVDLCNGDSTGRWLFRNYYDCWDMPVMDSIGKFYCCGQCQNSDSETHECGQMLVGDCCLEKHPNAIKLKPKDY
jgi:hypothetical protein